MNIKIDLVSVLVHTLCNEHIGGSKTPFCKSYNNCNANGGCPLFVEDSDNENRIKTLEELKEFIKEHDLNIKVIL